ncbi:MAG: SprT family protein [Bacillota bacterium]
MTESELQNLVQWVSSECFEKTGMVKTGFLHQASWNTRLRSTGGRYLPVTGNLEFNPRQLIIHGQEELVGVIKHELVHYHLHLQGLPFNHRSPYFKDLLARVGGTRFCQPTSERPLSRRNYHYTCIACGQHYYRQLQVNIRKYVCGRKGCGGRLILAGPTERV